MLLFPSLANALLPKSSHVGVRRTTIGHAGVRLTLPRMLMSDDDLLSDFNSLSGLRRLPRLALGRPSTVVANSNCDVMFVLLFNKGESNQGVYTLQSRHASESGAYLLAFECNDEASRFALMLQAEGFDLPSPTMWESDELVGFCTDTEFSLGFVPDGAMVLPPELNKYDESAFSEEREVHEEQKPPLQHGTWLDKFLAVLVPPEESVRDATDAFSDALSALDEEHLQEQLDTWLAEVESAHRDAEEGEDQGEDQGEEQGEEQGSLHAMMLSDQRGRLERLFADGDYGLQTW